MSEFLKSFFMGEYREGFYVEPMMKCAWAAQIKLAELIDEMCRAEGIRYFADRGTLLGAVRHKGFIPWDDDMDLCMLRKDYNHFLKVAERYLPEGCFLHSCYTQPDYRQDFCRVVNSHQVNFTQEFLKKWYGCPYIVGIDIFPLDRLPVSKDAEELLCELLQMIAQIVEREETDAEVSKQLLDKVEVLTGTKIDQNGNVKNQLLCLADALSQIYEDDAGEELTELCAYVKGYEYRASQSWFEEQIQVPFETIELPIPKEYDKVLRAQYGDYMTPVRGGADHDYPFYRKQQEMVDARNNRCL